MTKLKLGPFVDDRPVKLSIELPASVYRDLVAYGVQLARTAGATKTDRTGQIDRADAGTIYGDRPGLCKGAAAGVIDFPVILRLQTFFAQAREDLATPGCDCAVTRER